MSTTKHNAPLDSLALMKTVLDADQAVASQCIRGTTNWAAAIGKAVQDAVLRAQQPVMVTARKCAQCKKTYKHRQGSIGCPRCAPGVEIAEAEFQKPIEAAPATGNWLDADDVKRLVRQLDVALNGEAGAAVQASLCDVVAQVVHESAKLGHPLLQTPAAQQAGKPRAIKAMGYGGSTGINDYLMSDGTVKALRPAEVQWAAQADKGAPG